MKGPNKYKMATDILVDETMDGDACLSFEHTESEEMSDEPVSGITRGVIRRPIEAGYSSNDSSFLSENEDIGCCEQAF